MPHSADLKPLLLHAFPTSPNPLKIAIALEFLSIPYSVKHWEFGDDDTTGVKGATFLKISENGRVPVLEDPNTGVVSWESGAIMRHLMRVYGSGMEGGVLGLKGKVTEQMRVDFDKWELLLLTTLGPMIGQLAWYRYYNAKKNEDALDRYEKQVYRYLDVLEGQLKKSDGVSVLPEGFTAVDIHYYPWVRQPEFVGISLDKYPLTRKWIAGIAVMEEVKAAYQKFKEAAEQAGVMNVDEDGKILGSDSTLLREVASGKTLG